MALTNKLTTSVASVVGYGNSHGAVSCQLSKVLQAIQRSISISEFDAVFFQSCYGKQGPRALTIYFSQLVRRQNQLKVRLKGDSAPPMNAPVETVYYIMF